MLRMFYLSSNYAEKMENDIFTILHLFSYGFLDELILTVNEGVALSGSVKFGNMDDNRMKMEVAHVTMNFTEMKDYQISINVALPILYHELIHVYQYTCIREMAEDYHHWFDSDLNEVGEDILNILYLTSRDERMANIGEFGKGVLAYSRYYDGPQSLKRIFECTDRGKLFKYLDSFIESLPQKAIEEKKEILKNYNDFVIADLRQTQCEKVCKILENKWKRFRKKAYSVAGKQICRAMEDNMWWRYAATREDYGHEAIWQGSLKGIENGRQS